MEDNKTKNKLKRAKLSAKGHKALIIGLSAALVAATTAAVVAPTVIALNKKGGGEAVKTWQVTFDTDGGTIKQGKQVVTVNDKETTNPPTVEKDGFALQYWKDESGKQFDFTTPITANITLTAVWGTAPVTKVWKVTFNTDGGTIKQGKAEVSVNDKETVNPPTVEKSGWTLKQWNDKDGNKFDFATPITDNITLTADWEAVAKCTVTFDANGGEIVQGQSQVTVNKGGTVNPPAVQRTGYIFTQWNGEDGQKFDFATPITSDMTLTAQWKSSPEVETFNVTFDPNGGKIDGSESSKVIKAEKGSKINAANATKEGYTLSGWKAQGASTNWNFAVDTVTGDTTLVAQWTKNPSTTVKLKCHSGDYGKFVVSGTETDYYEVDVEKNETFGSVSKPEVKPDNDHIHVGWQDAQGQEILDTQKLTADTEVYVKYGAATKTVDITFSTKIFESGTATLKAGQSSITVNKGVKWGEIESSRFPIAEYTDASGLIATFEHWSLEKQTETGTIPPVVPSDHEFKAGETVYPSFNFANPTKTLTLTVEKVNEQQVIIGGTSTIEVPYKAGEIEKKFSEIIKPQVSEGTKVFDGYYHNKECTQEWANDQVLTETYVSTNNKIYVKMKDAVTDVMATFDTSDTKVTYVGATSVKCTRGQMLSGIAPTAYYEATPDPTKKVGYRSNYYFTNWKVRKLDGTEVELGTEDDYTINEAVTFIPVFAHKKELIFETNDATSPTTETVLFSPLKSLTWADLENKPTATAASSKTTGAIFSYWQGYIFDDDQHTTSTLQKILPSTPLSEIDFSDTKHITPFYTDQCHQLTFLEQAYNADTSSIITSFVVIGNLVVGAEFVAEGGEPLYVNSDINKPAVPTKPITEGGEYNDGYTFNHEWRIQEVDSTGQTVITPWADVTDGTSLPTGTTKHYYQLMPKVSAKFTLNYAVDQSIGHFVDASGSTVYTDTVDVDNGAKFGDVYKPQVVVDDANYEFEGWKDLATGTYYSVNSAILKPTSTLTLTAQFKSSAVSTMINYHIIDDANYSELNPTKTDFPAEALNSTNCFTVSKEHAKTVASFTFGDFTHIGASRNLYNFVGWGKKISEPTSPAADEYKRGASWYKLMKDSDTITAQTTTDLYAIFTSGEANFVKFSIAASAPTHVEGQPESYTIVGENQFYARATEDMPFDKTTGQIIGFDINVYAVGYEVDYWFDSDGVTKLEGKVQDRKYENIVPHFKTSTRNISFALKEEDKEAGATLSDSSKVIALPYYCNLLDYTEGTQKSKFAAPTAKKPSKIFDGWQLRTLNDDGTYEYVNITGDYKLTGDVTLVPKFVDETVYANGSLPYYYDETGQQWIQIQKFVSKDDPDSMDVRLSDGTYTTVNRYSINNVQIKMGNTMYTVPENFMFGCSEWTNGGHPLELPSSVNEIGKNFLYGCVSFNSQVTSTFTSSKLVIHDNFMSHCYSFNQNINLKYCGTGSEAEIYLSSGFMNECTSFAKELNLVGWTTWGFVTSEGEEITYDSSQSTTWWKYYETCLSTVSSTINTPTLLVSSAVLTDVQNMFPELAGPSGTYSSMYYRKLTINV